MPYATHQDPPYLPCLIPPDPTKLSPACPHQATPHRPRQITPYRALPRRAPTFRAIPAKPIGASPCLTPPSTAVPRCPCHTGLALLHSTTNTKPSLASPNRTGPTSQCRPLRRRAPQHLASQPRPYRPYQTLPCVTAPRRASPASRSLVRPRLTKHGLTAPFLATKTTPALPQLAKPCAENRTPPRLSDQTLPATPDPAEVNHTGPSRTLPYQPCLTYRAPPRLAIRVLPHHTGPTGPCAT